MVRWLAGYKKAQFPPAVQANPSGGPLEHKYTTYNILLKYGPMDLDVYFGAVLPPVLQSEIEAFWRSLFAIADAVKGIHNLKVCNAEETEEYYG